MTNVTMRAVGSICIIQTRYDPALTETIKRLPAWARGWNKEQKWWEIAPVLAPAVAEWLSAATGRPIAPPPPDAYTPPKPVTIRALYVAKVKGEDDWAAAHVMDEHRHWSAALWGPAVRQWFGAASAAPATLYSLIGVAETATTDEIERAIKRALRQWHPDVCREPDAADRTRAILEARAILTVPALRARYNAGLAAERLTRGSGGITRAGEYRPPLRSGIICGRGYTVVEKHVLVEITQWEDLTDAHGRTAVVSFPTGVNDPVVMWI